MNGCNSIQKVTIKVRYAGVEYYNVVISLTEAQYNKLVSFFNALESYKLADNTVNWNYPIYFELYKVIDTYSNTYGLSYTCAFTYIPTVTQCIP